MAESSIPSSTLAQLQNPINFAPYFDKLKVTEREAIVLSEIKFMSEDLSRQIEQLIRTGSYRTSFTSKLGFFCKPVRMITKDGREVVVKVFRTTSDQELMKYIKQNHDQYVEALMELGVRMPETKMHMLVVDGKRHLVVVQEAFKVGDLVREKMSLADEEEYLDTLQAVMKDTISFIDGRTKSGKSIGFHPTLRNYAMVNGELSYFDTFPPMYMNQAELNKVILKFTPLRIPIQGLVPKRLINMASNEYYQPAKMLIGLVGSSCRLRPEYADSVLTHARDVVMSDDRTLPYRDKVMKALSKPPRLNAVWLAVRNLLGKEGRPNI